MREWDHISLDVANQLQLHPPHTPEGTARSAAATHRATKKILVLVAAHIALSREEPAHVAPTTQSAAVQ